MSNKNNKTTLGYKLSVAAGFVTGVAVVSAAVYIGYKVGYGKGHTDGETVGTLFNLASKLIK
jgi:hypothetical protein